MLNKITTFSKRLREGLDAMGMKPSELSALTGISKSSISHYLKGDWEGKQDAVLFISKVLNVSEAWLMGYDVSKERTIGHVETGEFSNLIKLPEMSKVPLLGAIACGEPILANENIEDYINMPNDIKGDFALKCKGDSMINARITDGDIVYIRQQERVEHGEIGAVLIDNEATLKRVYYYPEKNTMILKAENTAYEDLIFTNEELNNIKIIGKAVGFYSFIN